MISRTLKYKILDSLKLKEITVLIGARQVGKTTLLKEIIGELDNVLYFNLDIEQDSVHFDSQEIFLQKVQLEVGTEKAYIFIDEIQQKEDAGRFMKGLYDMDLPYKFIVTGSGSIELKEKIGEALTGRKYMIEMSTVSFEEFVNYKTNYKYKKRLDTFFSVEVEKTRQLLEEYLTYGGYPAVITAETIIRKKEVMSEIFTSYLTKDISFLLGVKHPDKFVKMIKLLAVQSGAMVNYSTEPIRRVDFTFGIGYGDSVEKARGIINKLIEEDQRILKDPPSFIGLSELGDSSVNLTVRVWAKGEDYWGVFFDMNENVYNAFNSSGINIPFPQMDVHIQQN